MNKKEIVEKFSKAQDSLVIQQSDFSLWAISQMVEGSSINVSPHYQRRERWNVEKQSALIESFLINVPVPPVYLSEDDYGTYSVIDGKQRITSICNFLSGKLKLKNLKEFLQLEGLTFQELPMELRNALSVRPYIRVITLLKQSDPNLKYEVFLRLNTGGEKLRNQEVRNVAYSGPFNDLLFELSENEYLKEKLKIRSPKATAYRNMDDVEHVLRFFTIKENWADMGNVLSVEMDNFMASHRNDKVRDFKKMYNNSMDLCIRFWGENAFNKPLSDENGWRGQLISPLYDAQMVAASLLTPEEIKKLHRKKSKILKTTRKLFTEDAAFVKSVSQSTNNPSSIKKRIETIYVMLKSIE